MFDEMKVYREKIGDYKKQLTGLDAKISLIAGRLSDNATILWETERAIQYEKAIETSMSNFIPSGGAMSWTVFYESRSVSCREDFNLAYKDYWQMREGRVELGRLIAKIEEEIEEMGKKIEFQTVDKHTA